MGFFAPLFLAGLLGVGFPIWLHLLRQHRNVPMPFSSLMFFERRIQSSVRHRRLRYLLLLALRIALIVLLALLFANPYLNRPAAGAAGARLLIVAIDNSFSMRQGDQISKAKQDALSVLGSLKPGESAQVLAFSNSIKVMNQGSSDASELRGAVAAVEAGDARSSYGELSRTLRLLAQSSKQRMEVHLFSDLQKTSMPPGFADLQLPDGAKLILHPSATGERPNWTVETVTAPARIYEPKKVRVQATIAGYQTPAAQKRVSLVAGDRVLESKTVTVPPSGRATVEFLGFDVPYGYNKAEVRVDGGDVFPNDDRYLISVERADPRKVLFVHEARDSRSPLYFRTALESAANAAFTLETATSEQSTNLSLDKYAFIVVSDVGSAPQSFQDNLNKWVRGGGSVLVALGSVTAAKSRVPIFDEAIVESRYAARSAERFLSSDQWEGVKFFQVIRFEPGKSTVLAKLGDGTPVLAEKQVGEGRAVVFASTFDNVANDFPLHASFIPFVEETAYRLAHQRDVASSFSVGGLIELRAAQDRATSIEVIDPQGKRALSLDQATRAETFQLPSEGYFEIRRSNGRQQMVAVNADRRESNLSPIDKETLELWQNTGQGSESNADAKPGESDTKPWSFWWYVLFVLFLVSVTESLVGSRFIERDETEELVNRKEAA